MVRYLRAFLPLIVFSTIGDHAPRLAALIAFGLAALSAIQLRRRGAAWDEFILEMSSAVFFGALALAAYTVAARPLGGYPGAAAAGWVALTAWGSVIVRRPFTLGIARGIAPPEAHDDPRFYRVNAVISSAWAAGFTVEAIGLAAVLTAAPHTIVALIVVKAVSLGAPALFTVRYPAIMRKRARRQLPQQPAYPRQGQLPQPAPYRGLPTGYPPKR